MRVHVDVVEMELKYNSIKGVKKVGHHSKKKLVIDIFIQSISIIGKESNM